MKSGVHCEGAPPTQGRPPAPEQEVFLRILRSADVLTTGLAGVLKKSKLSPTQYNVLRILRGAGEEGMPCGKIAQRMITHDPDMTRLLDRLEKRKVIERWRDAIDRRVVRARITPAGLRLVLKLDDPVAQLHRRQLGHLSASELKSLPALLAKVLQRQERT